METLLLFSFAIIFFLIALRPVNGLYLMALFLPVLGIDIHIYSFIFPLIDLLAMITFLAWLLNRFYFWQKKSKQLEPLKWPLFWPFAIFFIANLLSVIFANNPGDSLYYFIRWPFFLYVVYVFLPANIIQNVATLKKTVILIFASTVLMLITAYLSLINQDFSNNFFRVTGWFFKGFYPYGNNHNLIAEFLNIGVFFILIIKEFIKKARFERLINVIFVMTVLAIILTFSRAAWITLALQLIVYLAYRWHYQKKEIHNIVVLILFSLFLITPLAWRMSFLQSENYGSTASRLLLNNIAIKAWQAKPLFGHGSGEFINLVAADIRFTANHGAPMDSHGFLQKILAENGSFGLVAWIFILIYVARFAFLAVQKYYPQVKWVLPFALAVGGGLFFQFFNTSYYKGKVWLPLVLFIIAIELSEKNQRKKYVAKN